MVNNFYVYCLYQDSKIVYVGSTTNLDSRLLSHSRQKTFNKVKFCHVHSQEAMLDLEQYYISRYKPVYNKQGKVRDVIDYIGVLPLWEYVDDEVLRYLNIKQDFSQVETLFDELVAPREFLSAKEFDVSGTAVKLNLVEKMVYLCIRFYYLEKLEIPTYPQIANQFDCDSKTISRVFTKLKASGIVDVTYGQGNRLIIKNLVELINNS
jgi:hypothetical protein